MWIFQYENCGVKSLVNLNKCYTQYYVVLKQVFTSNNIKTLIFQYQNCVVFKQIVIKKDLHTYKSIGIHDFMQVELFSHRKGMNLSMRG